MSITKCEKVYSLFLYIGTSTLRYDFASYGRHWQATHYTPHDLQRTARAMNTLDLYECTIEQSTMQLYRQMYCEYLNGLSSRAERINSNCRLLRYGSSSPRHNNSQRQRSTGRLFRTTLLFLGRSL